jgi:general secretion pathway protein N
MRILLFVMVVLAILVATAPAKLVDFGLSEASRGGVRLGSASGSIWNGRGVISVLDVTKQVRQPWFGVEWTFDPFGLFRGRLSWKIICNGANASGLAVGVSGWQVSDLKIAGPARNFLQRIPGTLSGFGWEGDISLAVTRFECSWRNLCAGKIGASWAAAGTDFLPGQVFGDYRVDAEAVAGTFAFDWSSSDTSYVRTWGKGGVSDTGALHLDGNVTGAPELLSRLPAIAGPWVRPTGAGDTWKIVFP